MSVHIEVLGPGCVNCQRLLANTERAVGELGLDARVESVHGIERMVEHGVMASPALVVDRQVVFAGLVPDVEGLKHLLSEVDGREPIDEGRRSEGGA